MVFRADNSSDEQLRISRIEEILQGDSRAYSQLPTPRLKEPSPRARFSQHVSHKALPHVPASIAVKSSGSVAAAEKESTDWGEAASNSLHFEKLVQILGCLDQRVQTRELNKELDNIRENLKQMKGRVHLMTERLDVQETSETPQLPLEPHERHVRHKADLPRLCSPFSLALAVEITSFAVAHGCNARNRLERRYRSGEIVADAIGGAAGDSPPARCGTFLIALNACVTTQTFLRNHVLDVFLSQFFSENN
jgi:hypothetical protein